MVVKVMRCALYGRVSTVRQARTVDGGLDTQFDLMQKFVAFEVSKGEHEWQVVDRYREEAYSGKNLDRPEFRRLKADVDSGRVNVVIVQKIDRITRSLKDFYALWEFFQEHDVQFISLHEKFDTTGAIGRAMLKLILVFAELEREQTGERTKATMSHRARQGLWNGGSRFGYDLDPAKKGVLVVNPEHARVVREHFFQKCVDLGSAGKVTTHLQKIGLREPTYRSRQGRDRGGVFFDKQKVIRVLTDPVYLGKIAWEGELYPGRHEPIVDQTLFDEVQAILARNREKKGNYRDQRQHVFVLQGLARCGRCGGFLTPKTSTGRGGKKHFYYVCTTVNHTNGGACDLKYVPAEAAEEFVLGEIKKWAMTPAEVERVVREANGRADATLGGLVAEEKALRQRLVVVQARIDPLVTAIEDGAGFGSVKDRLTAAEAEKASVEGELAKAAAEIEQLRQHALSLDAVAATYSDFPTILDALRLQGDQYGVKRLIGMFVEVIEWHQDTTDPSKGTVDIQLFEQAQPGEEGREKDDPDAPPVNSGASGCLERLPERNTPRTPRARLSRESAFPLLTESWDLQYFPRLDLISYALTRVEFESLSVSEPNTPRTLALSCPVNPPVGSVRMSPVRPTG